MTHQVSSRIETQLARCALRLARGRLLGATIGLVLGFCGLASVSPAMAEAYGNAVTYQGELKDAGVPVNGPADFVFRLHTAASGGVQAGATISLSDVVLTDGVFTVDLDFTSNGTIPGVYDGNARWLEINVNGTTLSPRQRFAPAPHSVMAKLLALPFSQQTTANPAFQLVQDLNAPQARVMHIASTSVDTGSVAFIGEMLNETLGNGTGVLGISRAGNGFGVIGTNLSPVGNCTGVYGNVESTDGNGVLGVANHPSGATKGVYGQVESPNGWAGYFDGRGYFNGHVGIGIEEPQALLHISGPPSPSGLALNAYDHLYVGSGNNFVAVNRFFPVTASEYFGVRAPVTGTNYGGMYMETESATAKPFYGYAAGGVAKAWTYFDAQADEWRLYANGDRVVIPRLSGNFGIKRTPLVNDLEVEGTASKTTSGSWLANSDRRIKKNVQTVGDALDRLNRVRLVSFRYEDEYRARHPEIEDRTYLNVIAQEFQEVFPDEVKGSGERLANGEEILQVDTYPLTIYSAAAIQELHALVREQRKMLEAQETAIARLEGRLARLEAVQEPTASAIREGE